MKLIFISTAFVVTSALAMQAHAYQTGLRDLTIASPDGSRNLEGFVWYPTDQSDGGTVHHGNPVWAGIDAIEDAPPASGPFPLVVLSHGMYGNAMNQAWLASELSKRGFVVAAVNHPGTSTWLRDPDDARKLWERPKDVSRTIDHLLAAPATDLSIDPDRIFMAGHSLGGFTAIALAGGRYDAEKVDAQCNADPGEKVCGILRGWYIAETPEDRAMMAQDLSDPRIRGFAVFDLGATQSFSPDSLAVIRAPMLIYGAPRNIDGTGLNLDLESRALVAALPTGAVDYKEPETLAHFDFLGECTPNALNILKEEEPDDVFVCADGVEERRAEHQMIADEVAGFFGKPEGDRP